MRDLLALKARSDVRLLIEQDLGPAPLHQGRAWHWKCPFHHEQKGFSLVAWADGYQCFGRCHERGDALDWLTRYRHLTFADALNTLDTPQLVSRLSGGLMDTRQAGPPSSEWQERALAVITEAEETLWSLEGASALEYLMDRGLTTRTIRDARLGYVPGDFRAFRDLHGLRVPCGITLPWLDEDKLWSVKVRRAAGEVKYAHIAGGSGSGLYNADALTDATTVVLCEGEFDALLLKQEAGDRLTAVTLGSASARLTPRWLPHLLAIEQLFITYDADEAGQRGATYLGSMLPHAQRLSLPMGNDITDFYLRGGDLQEWIDEHKHNELV